MLTLRAGALSTTLHGGRLGPVHAAGHELWHGVQWLLRDAHWRTPALLLGEPVQEPTADGWRVRVLGCLDLSPPVPLRIDIEGREDGTLVFTGEAHVPDRGDGLDVNRLGLCLLHPLSAAGRPVEITHDDGRLTQSTFPEQVPAWPPFLAIRAMRHVFAPGGEAEATFEGDSFEFEDQRNNADASFKTYSRSNFMPRPYRLAPGSVVRQRVSLRLLSVPQDAAAGAACASPAAASAPCRDAGPSLTTTPSVLLGIELLPEDIDRFDDTRERLVAFRPDVLHLAWTPGVTSIDTHRLAALLAAAGASLRVDLMLGAASAGHVVEVHTLREALAAAAIAPSDVAIFPSLPAAVHAAREAFPNARIGGGTPDFFVQLNRAERLPALDFLSFTVCPIVHAADDETVRRSPQSYVGLLATLAARHPGVPVQVGPSRIAARRSPLGALADSDGQRPTPLAAVDPREATAFGAEWTRTHVAELQRLGAQAVTVSRLAEAVPGTALHALWCAWGRRRTAAVGP